MAFKSEDGFVKFGFVRDFMSMTLSFQKGAFGFWVKPDKSGELEVTGEIRGETQAVRIRPFTFPKEMASLRHWAAYMARGVFGDETHFAKLETLSDDVLPPGLRNLFMTGFRYAHLLGDEPAPARPHIPATKEGGENMKGCPFNHAEIDEAFTLVVEQLGEERNRLYSAGAKAMLAQNADEAQRILGLQNDLQGFLEEVEAVARKWHGLQQRIDGVPSEPEPRESPTVGEGPTNGGPREQQVPSALPFVVRFGNGREISGERMNDVLSETVAVLGIERVAALGVMLFDDPLLTKDKARITKMPTAVKDCGDGWFLKTQGNPYVLNKVMEDIGVRLGEPLTVTITRKQKPKPPKPTPVQPIPEGVRVGRIVKKLFPEAFRRGKVSEREFKRLVAKDSSRIFGTGGRQVLLEDDGRRTRDEYARYYSDVRIEHGGKRYLLTSQFVPESYSRVVAWLNQRGFTKREILEAGRGRTPGPTLFD